MTQVTTNESLTRYATANLNRPSHGDNGTDHMVFTLLASAGRRGLEVPAAGRLTDGVSAGAPRAIADDAAIEEGYASAAGLGLVLVIATLVGAAALGALVIRAVLALVG
jgi:hypothetical protein